MEQTLLKKYKKYQYQGLTPFKHGTKSTECFIKDISTDKCFLNFRNCDIGGNPLE